MSVVSYEPPTLNIDALYELAMAHWCEDTIPSFAEWILQQCGDDIRREVCKILYNFLLPQQTRPESGLISLIQNAGNHTGCGLLPIPLPM
jgi:hypothetical protein